MKKQKSNNAKAADEIPSLTPAIQNTTANSEWRNQIFPMMASQLEQNEQIEGENILILPKIL